MRSRYKPCMACFAGDAGVRGFAGLKYAQIRNDTCVRSEY
jgi:hypothetical protein